MSQLIEVLRMRLREELDPLMRAELEARLAGNEARRGDFESARTHIDHLRAEHGGSRTNAATLWIMLAEGLLHLYEHLSPLALDRIGRALLLAEHLHEDRLAGLAAAWKSHIEFENADYQAMVASFRLAQAKADPLDLEAQTRLSMVISNALMCAGDISGANRWFVRGHELAVKNGDRISIEALQYNRAVFWLYHARIENCKRGLDPSELDRLGSELRTAYNLQKLTNVGALTNLVELGIARLALLRQEWQCAIDSLSLVRTKKPFAAHDFNQELVDLEICYCEYQEGQVEAALDRFDKSGKEAGSAPRLDLDERIVGEWLKWKLASADPRFGDAAFHRVALDRLLAQHEAECKVLRQLVNSTVVEQGLTP